MSQKSSKRSRKHTHESSDPDFKPPLSLKHAIFEEQKHEESISMTENGNKSETSNGETKEETERVKTRSRSNTPLKKKRIDIEEEDNQEMKTNGDQINEETTTENGTINDNKEEIIMEMLEIGDMDPLILTDEVDPELTFEENSDFETKGSPTLGRCQTRRSQSKTIPTPQTPKSEEVVNDEAINESTSEENVSTNVEVGGDSTRLDFTETEENSFLNQSKNKTLAETLRGLSSRRTIRPISCDYRKKVLMRNNMDKSDLNVTYPLRNSIERISIGMKRKNSSSDFADGKRFKNDDSPGFISRILSPLSMIRNKFKSDLNVEPTDSPKLTVYKDDNFLVEKKSIIDSGAESKWCTIM